MQVVPLVLEDLFESLRCLKIDGFVALVKCRLPVGLAAVMESISPLPCSQCCVPLAPAELWLVSRCIRGSGVFADVEDRDAAAVLFCDLGQQVWIGMPVGWLLPGFPNC